MKTKLLILLPVSAMLMLTACQKEKSKTGEADEIETTFTLSENQAVSESIADDATEVFIQTATQNGLGAGRMFTTAARLAGCGTVSITPASGFPKTMTIDFGTGCTTNGVVRKGIIQIVLTDSIHKYGSVATMTFNNYSVYDYKVEGTITWTNKTTPNGIAWTRSIENGKVTNPAGTYYWLHVGNKQVQQTAGVNTPLDLSDDVYAITGSHTVTNPQGKSREVAIMEALEKKVSCENISAGTLKVQGPNHYAVFDYGRGSCDKIASISIDGRPARTFMLP